VAKPTDSKNQKPLEKPGAEKPEAKPADAPSAIDGSTPLSHHIPTPAAKGVFAVSPVFGFVFARRGNNMHALYRLIADPDGRVTEMKEVFAGSTRSVIKAMINSTRKFILDGTFRTGVVGDVTLADAPKKPEAK